MAVQGPALRTQSSELYHVGIRGQEPRLVFIHETGNGLLQQKKQGWNLLHKPTLT